MVQVTFYARTGYSFSDEPASDTVINLNEHWDMSQAVVMHDPANKTRTQIKVEITDEDLSRVDYIKLSENGQRWYYFVAGHQRVNAKVVVIQLIQDSFSTVGLDNIRFFGNVTRRSLTPDEATRYDLLPEPWAPRRPLLTRKVIIDTNVNKTVRLPSRISLTFEETETDVSNTAVIDVPNSPLGVTTSSDELDVSLEIPIGYPNPASHTAHRINTPWGEIEYITQYESYYTLSGTALSTFLMKAKKYNSLDLISPPYYLPAPESVQNVTLTEIANPNTRNPKAGRFYTSITIRSLASGQSRTFGDTDMLFTYEMPLAVMVAPDKLGGTYVLPANVYTSGKNPNMYLEGVYSPFETYIYNAVGDTPAKFAADGTNIVNQSLNQLFETYIQKVNALQMQGMQAKYLKDIGSVKSLVMAFSAEAVGSISETITTTEQHDIITDVSSTTDPVTTSINQNTRIPRHSQTSSGSQSPSYNATPTRTTVPPVGQEINTFSDNENISYADNNRNGADLFTESYGSSENWGYARSNYTQGYTTETTNPMGSSTNSGTVTIEEVNQRITGDTTTGTVKQTGKQTTHNPKIVVTAVTENKASTRSLEQGNEIAIDGIDTIYQSTAPNLSATPTWGTLQTLVFGQFQNEVHSFMLGNINDYLNRWASIQNDLHNGRVANLFKNVTIVGNYSDVNKLAGKYEILITYLNPLDEANFDLFLDHFGHAVDEYSTQLVRDSGKNYTYTMVGDDSMFANTVKQDANPVIANQFKTGVRVWKTLIRPENFN